MSDMKAKILKEGSRWFHTSDASYVIEVTAVGRSRALVARPDGSELSLPLSLLGAEYLPAPPAEAPTPRACWAVVGENDEWITSSTKGDAEWFAREWGGRWIAPVAPNMGEAVWVPGDAS